MPNNVLVLPQAEMQLCAQCGEHSARLNYQNEQFPYGAGKDRVILTARVPVWKCEACDAQYTDCRSEEIRHAEICRHLGRLTPTEVRNIREQYGFSQQEWAAQTRLGLASIKRWETGNLIQNEATDCYMRLLSDPHILSKVAQMGTASRLPSYRFQTKLPDVAYEHASMFELRKSNRR
jgi:putative zinc finger/helix-turn-helix YgiT family protein